jgi:hypothetical protein
LGSDSKCDSFSAFIDFQSLPFWISAGIW